MPDECGQVGGRGCEAFVDAAPASACPPDSDTADRSGQGEAAESDARVEGEGICATAGGPSWLTVLAILFVWVRRVLLLLLIVGPAHAGVDAWSLRTLDGGPWVLLPDPDVGRPWSPRAALSVQYAQGLVKYWEGSESTTLLGPTIGTEIGGSIRIAGLIRFGASMVGYPVLISDHTWYDDVVGDAHVWAAVPIHSRMPDGRGWDLAWIVGAAVPTGEPALWVGDPEGSLRADLSVGGTAGGFDLLGTLGVRLAIPTPLPGLTWGNRLAFGAGVQHPLVGPTWASVELGGTVGLPPLSAEGDLPIEALLSVGGNPWNGVGLTGGLGAGFTHGLGSPSLRVLLMGDFRSRDWPDSDQDTLPDYRDACVLEPEDFDDIEDLDGCPEVDADGDRILDPVDRCPVTPEVYNGVRDEDGCADSAVRLHIEVDSADPDVPMEQAVLRLGDGEAVALVDAHEATVAPGVVHVHVESPGFVAVDEDWRVPARTSEERRVFLEPVRFGQLCATLVDADGAGVAGHVDGVAVPAEGSCFQAQSGRRTISAVATGFSTRRIEAEIPRDGELRLRIVLQRSRVWQEGDRLDLEETLRFPLGSAEAENLPVADDVATWLKEHPDVRLLRVEGHADQTGGSAYNRELSLRRATVVRDRLVALGIAPERLEVVASGEARRPGDDPRRLVEFWVIVWDD